MSNRLHPRANNPRPPAPAPAEAHWWPWVEGQVRLLEYWLGRDPDTVHYPREHRDRDRVVLRHLKALLKERS